MKTLKRNIKDSNDLTADLQKIKDAFSDAAFDLKEKANSLFTDSFDGVKDKSAEVQDKVATYTATKPLKSLGIAMLVGAAAMYLLRR